MVNHEEYMELQAQLQDHFDGRYVQIEDCDLVTTRLERKLNNDNVRLAVIEQQNKLILWILAAIAGGIITMLVNMFFGG